MLPIEKIRNMLRELWLKMFMMEGENPILSEILRVYLSDPSNIIKEIDQLEE